MKFLKRNVKIYTLPARTAGFIQATVRIFFIFRQPFQVLRHYIQSTVPENGFVELRNGYRITFSGHKHDLISTIIVFCKQDYGRVKPGSICLDIGANIGMFALYAVSQGAEFVYAFEANQKAYGCMVHNINSNNLHNRIQAHNVAVTNRTGDLVAFPAAPSPYNRISSLQTEETIDVETISLVDVIHLTPEGHVDILQMDIEGAEYAVFTAVQDDELQNIDEIRPIYRI